MSLKKFYSSFAIRKTKLSWNKYMHLIFSSHLDIGSVQNDMQQKWTHHNNVHVSFCLQFDWFWLCSISSVASISVFLPLLRNLHLWLVMLLNFCLFLWEMKHWFRKRARTDMAIVKPIVLLVRAVTSCNNELADFISLWNSKINGKHYIRHRLELQCSHHWLQW